MLRTCSTQYSTTDQAQLARRDETAVEYEYMLGKESSRAATKEVEPLYRQVRLRVQPRVYVLWYTTSTA